MTSSVYRLDLTTLFCDIDDFWNEYECYCERHVKRLPYVGKAKRYRSKLSLSEVMTIVVAFHSSGYRTFKDFYIRQVLADWQDDFPNLVSYNRFVELMPWSLFGLVHFLKTRLGRMSGVSFVDSTPLEVCHPKRAHAHKTFKPLALWGKCSVGWYFGFKLHIVINDSGELIALALTPANTDDRKPIRDMTKDLLGKLFGDRGYVSQALFEELFERGLTFISKRKKNMKNMLVKLRDKILLRKRAIIESVNDQLKNICQIEHSRHRSRFNFLVNLLAGLIAYSYHPKKPSLQQPNFDRLALPEAIY